MTQTLTGHLAPGLKVEGSTTYNGERADSGTFFQVILSGHLYVIVVVLVTAVVIVIVVVLVTAVVIVVVVVVG